MGYESDTAVDEPGASQAPPAFRVEAKPWILVVDDVEDNRSILRRWLERRNFEVLEASSGTDALKFLSCNTCDVELLDVMMREIDGIVTLCRIRASHSDGSLPVIMVTAKSQPEYIVAALDAGAGANGADAVSCAKSLGQGALNA